MADRILICDDEELVRWSLREHLRQEGFEVAEAEDGETFLQKMAELAPDLAVLDLKLPRIDGLECLRRLRADGNSTPVVMLTAVGTVSSVIEATKLGAATYLTKPFELKDVSDAVRDAMTNHRARTTITSSEGGEIPGYRGIIGASPAMRQLFDTLRSLSEVDTPSVLITGESGSGKDVIARAIHEAGPRRSSPFVEVDCASIPENLIESTLFGHERGAFTDAKAQHKGLFEEGRGGIVFMDEMGELPQVLQAKLLRALENRTFKRVGGNTNIAFDAAVIAATNRDMKQDVATNRFRADLYYRLAVVEIHVPPLRARREDIPLLADHFVRLRNQAYGKNVKGFTEEAMNLIVNYRWPGNVRELRNTIDRLMIFQKDPIIPAESLPPALRFSSYDGTADCPYVLPEGGVSLDAVERGLVMQALERTRGNQTAAAKLLDLSRFALRTRMKNYGMLQ